MRRVVRQALDRTQELQRLVTRSVGTGTVAGYRGKREVEFEERVPNCLLIRRLRAVLRARVAQTRHAVLRPSEALAPAPHCDSLGEDEEVLTVSDKV